MSLKTSKGTHRELLEPYDIKKKSTNLNINKEEIEKIIDDKINNTIINIKTGVGKEDITEPTGEIFNDYKNNSASGEYAHAEGGTF